MPNVNMISFMSSGEQEEPPITPADQPEHRIPTHADS